MAEGTKTKIGPTIDTDQVIVDVNTNITRVTLGHYTSDFVDFNTAITHIGSTDTKLYVNSNTTLSSNCTVPINVEIEIIKGFVINCGGNTLTINGSLSCGRYQAFSGTGAISLNNNTIVYTQWFGILGNSTDESVLIQKAVNASNNADLFFPAGTFKCSNITMKSGVYIIGAGNNSTFFNPASNAPLFIQDAGHLMYAGWKKLTIDGGATKAIYDAQDGINISPGVGMFSESLLVEDVTIKHCGRYGWYSRGTSSVGQFIQRLFINRSMFNFCAHEGIWLDGDHYETTFRDVWSCVNGNGLNIANTRFGSTDGSNHGPQRLTWTGGGIMSTFANSASRYVPDGRLNQTYTTFTATAANFTTNDVGKPIVISLGNTSFSPAHITTIASRISNTQVTITDPCPVSGSLYKTIINTPITGGIVLSNCASVNLVGIEFEECGVFAIIEGPMSQNVTITGSSFISSKPVVSAIWHKGYFGGKFNLHDWSLTTSDTCFWGMLSSQANGSYNASATHGFVVDSPVHGGQIVYGLTSFFEYSFATNGIAPFSYGDIPILRLDGLTGFPVSAISQPVNGLNVTSGYKQGQMLTLVTYSSSGVIEHNKNGIGNIALAGGLNFVLAKAAYAPYISNRLTLMWDNNVGKWIEISRST